MSYRTYYVKAENTSKIYPRCGVYPEIAMDKPMSVKYVIIKQISSHV